MKAADNIIYKYIFSQNFPFNRNHDGVLLRIEKKKIEKKIVVTFRGNIITNRIHYAVRLINQLKIVSRVNKFNFYNAGLSINNYYSFLQRKYVRFQLDDDIYSFKNEKKKKKEKLF